MNQVRPFSSPELLPSSTTNSDQPGENVSFEGVATNVKALLKLIHEHNGNRTKDNDERKSHRVAGMISIIDEVKSRIQRIQSSSKRRAELRRCNTELEPNIAKDKKPPDLVTDEKGRLRRELTASLVARKSLEAMCSSLDKEKQIMASELARKAQELTEMEEFITDLKAQNEMLLEKFKGSNSEQEERNNEMEMQGNIALQERNMALSEQLHKSLDAYQSLKRKFKNMQEENLEIQATMEETKVEVQAGINRINGFKDQMVTTNEETDNIKEEISALENMLESLNMKISKHRQKKIE